MKAKKVSHLTKCYSKLAKILIKKIWHAHILISNQAGPSSCSESTMVKAGKGGGIFDWKFWSGAQFEFDKFNQLTVVS